MTASAAAAPRKVPATTMARVAANTLGRMACHHGDPRHDDHDHAGDCLRDDESFAADRLLRLIYPAIMGDEDAVLEQLTALLDSIDRES